MNRNILVIGANGALGQCVVRQLQERGDIVAATVSRPEKLDTFRKEFPACDPVIALDLSDPERVKSELTHMIGGMSRLDGIVTCAALAPVRPLEFTPIDLLQETLATNAVSAAAIYQASIDALRASKGRLIFTSSLNGKVAIPMQGAYTASKFALEALADTMRQECADWGVEVVLLEPGGFATPTVGKVVDALGRTATQAPEKERALYGELCRQMHDRLASALADPNLMSADTVAAKAVEALDAETPETRYGLGPEADLLLTARKEKSDREMDALLLSIFRQTAA